MNDSFNDTRDEVPCLNLKNVRKYFRCRNVGELQSLFRKEGGGLSGEQVGIIILSLK